MSILLTSDLVRSVVDVPGGYSLSWDERLFATSFVEPIRARRFITRLELLTIGRWKAVRATGNMCASDSRVRMVSAAAFEQTDPGLANWILRHLSGVGAPMASAVLTVFDETAYTVIDVRAVSSLRNTDFVSLGLERPSWLEESEPTQNSYTYGRYVDLCCVIAAKLHVTLRELDRCLWALDGRESIPPKPHA